MVSDHLSVFGTLACPILALPAKNVSGQEVISIPMIGVHILFGQRYKEEDIRRANHEAHVPNCGVERLVRTMAVWLPGDSAPTTSAPNPNVDWRQSAPSPTVILTECYSDPLATPGRTGLIAKPASKNSGSSFVVPAGGRTTLIAILATIASISRPLTITGVGPSISLSAHSCRWQKEYGTAACVPCDAADDVSHLLGEPAARKVLRKTPV